MFFNDILQAPAKPRQEGRRKSQKIRKAQISSGKSEIFSDLIPTFFRFFRLFSAGIVGVGIFNFISFNAELFSFWDSFKQGVPGSIPGWLTNHKPLCNRKCVYYKGFSCFLRVFNTLSFCITAIEKAVNFGFNAPELI